MNNHNPSKGSNGLRGKDVQTTNPYISVVITSHNREQYIGQAIDSVLAQDCRFPIEIIIADDCSTDNSRALLQTYKAKYPDIVVLKYQESHIGLGANWASACQMARGKYVACLDDDDYWCDSHRLQLMADYLDAHADCGLVYTNRWILRVATGKKTLADTCIPADADKLDYMLHRGFPICFSSVLLRKSLLDTYVNLDDYVRLRFPIQDWPTALLLAPHCTFHYIDRPGVVYRSYSGSMSRPETYEQITGKCDSERVMCSYIMDQLQLPFDEPGWDRHVNHLLMALAYKRGDYPEAKRYALQSGERTLKAMCARTWLTFQLFRGVRLKKAL